MAVTWQDDFVIWEDDFILWHGVISFLSLGGSIAAQSGVVGDTTVTKSLTGSLDAQSTTSADAAVIESLAGLIAAQSALTGETFIGSVYILNGLIAAQSGVSGDTTVTEELAGLIEVHSGVGFSDTKVVELLAGSLAAQSGADGNIQWVKDLAGSVAAQSNLTSAEVQKALSLSGTVAAVSVVTGDAFEISQLAGAIAAQSALTAKLRDLTSLSGTCDAHTTVGATINETNKLAGIIAAQATLLADTTVTESLAGLIAAQSTVAAILQTGYAYMPPAMHASLIDPQQKGAWLWLVEVKLPGYDIIRYVRNTEDVTYSGFDFTAWNFQNTIPKLTSDGSVSRTTVKIAQDASYTLEDKINALQGKCSDGHVQLIRAHVDYLDKFVKELEYFSYILKVDSDWEWVTFKLGIPAPLRIVIPMRIFSSKTCPFAVPELFKGVECGYSGPDPICTGLYEDCFTKGNAPRYGGELGLERRVQ